MDEPLPDQEAQNQWHDDKECAPQIPPTHPEPLGNSVARQALTVDPAGHADPFYTVGTMDPSSAEKTDRLVV